VDEAYEFEVANGFRPLFLGDEDDVCLVEQV
jgi:hypothetical protein